MRLIDADAVAKHLFLDEEYQNCSNDYNEGIKDAIKAINNAPTVDTVKHGKWVAVNPDERGFTDIFACSCCENIVWTMSFTKKLSGSAYCSKCGAKLDEEAGNEG